MKTTLLILATLLAASLPAVPLAAAEGGGGPDLFAKKNLVAWCIVPFDAAPAGGPKLAPRCSGGWASPCWPTTGAPSTFRRSSARSLP